MKQVSLTSIETYLPTIIISLNPIAILVALLKTQIQLRLV